VIPGASGLGSWLWFTVILADATSDGFSAHVTHASMPVRWVIFGGNMRSPDPAIQTGEIYCSEP